MKILILLLFGLVPIVCNAQSNVQQNCPENYLLNTKFPSVYVSFEKFGKRTPRYSGESNEGVWLRFHNNTKWNVTIKTLGTEKEYGDFHIFYEIDTIGRKKEKADNPELPIGYRMGHISRVYTLKSNDSFLFSVPREHLATDFYLQIEFSYEWEQKGNSGGGGNIIHKATFFSSDLPK